MIRLAPGELKGLFASSIVENYGDDDEGFVEDEQL